MRKGPHQNSSLKICDSELLEIYFKTKQQKKSLMSIV